MNASGAMVLQRTGTGGFVSRIQPLLPAHAMTTFEVRQPLATHFRSVSCEEAQCSHFAAGWITGFSDVDLPHKWDAAQTYGQLATKRGLKFMVHRTGNTVTFTFPAGQQCLEGHRVALDRPPLFIVRNGDWRGNPRRQQRVHQTGADFQEHWMESQARLDRAISKG